ncbi:MAG: energy-coupling factor transporter transmembrane protein EcfT [Treponema sp.]|jgi:energy-coupling factor transport system permease protein|nr:energy-coupling factor transporter transmembrane protein EcfT [Treponema sp.]
MPSGDRALLYAVKTENAAVRTSGFQAAAKVFVFFCAILGVSLAADINRTWVLSLMGLAYLLFQQARKQFISWLVFYGLLSVLLFLNLRHGFHTKIISEYYIYTLWWLTPVFIVSWDLISSPPGNLIAFLSRLRAPSPVILGTLVIFRFFPTMKTALRNLGESLRNRGLLGPGTMLRHPLAVFEYILVPLLLRCLQIADQLSVSAISRGIEAPVKRESYYEQKMKGRDYLCMAAAGGGTLFFLLYWGIG